jgi:hypothetical protein
MTNNEPQLKRLITPFGISQIIFCAIISKQHNKMLETMPMYV